MISKEDFLKSKGWSTWYHHDYWVHPKMVKGSKNKDYTKYGLPTDAAFIREAEEYLLSVDSEFNCPLNFDGCKKNCGSYGCGN